MQITHRFNKLKPSNPEHVGMFEAAARKFIRAHLDYNNPSQKKAPKMSIIRIMGQAFTATVTPAFTVVLEDQS